MPANYQQNYAPLRRRVLLVVLLVLAVALTTVYAREGATGPLHSVQDRVLALIAPFGRAGAQLGTVTEAAGTAAGDAAANEATLSALREQNQQLRQMLVNAEEYRLEAERLRDLLNMKRVAGVSGKVAHIIGRSANAWDQSITIDLGSADRVEPGMTVLGATGVIGQVVRTTEHTAVVRLLTDPNSGAAVKIQSSRAEGVVRGSVSGVLYLEDLEEDVIPEVGDVVITSGLGGSYESGLVVGTIVTVNKTTGNASGDVIVSPNSSAYMLEEVLVVMDENDDVVDVPDAGEDEEEESEEAGESAEGAAASESASSGSMSMQDSVG